MTKTKLLLMMLIMSLISTPALFSQTNFINPADGEQCADVLPEIDWEYTGSNNVHSYTLQVSENPNFTSFVVNEALLVSSIYQVETSLDYNTAYYMRVITQFTPSGTEVSDTVTFTTIEAPPNTKAPLDSAYCIALDDIVFKWSIANAGQYELDISTSNTFGAGNSVSGYPVTTTLTSHTFTSGPLDKNTVYYWKVRADFGAPCGWSDSRDTLMFRTIADPPALSAPADGVTCVEETPQLTWSAVSGAANYDIQISSTSDFDEQDIIYEVMDFPSTLIQIPAGELVENEDHWWRVRANFSGSCSTDWTAFREFKTGFFQPMIHFPAAGQGGLGLEPEIVWSVNPDLGLPLSFELQVADNSSFTTPIYDETIVPTDDTTKFDLDSPTLSYSTEYWLRIRANYGGPDNCVTEWSDEIKFATQYPKALGINPVDGVACIDLEYTFQWNPVQGADTYRVQVSENADMSNPEVDSANVDDISKMIVLLNGNTKYYWRVRAEDNITFGPWSNIWGFTTTLKAPEHLEPENEAAGLDALVTFAWEDLGEGVIYQLRVSESSDLTNPIIDEPSLSSTTFTGNVNEYFTTFYWSVRAYGEQCGSAWSSPTKFSTAIQPPKLIQPSHMQEKVSLIPTYIWQKSPVEGVTYIINVSKTDDFSTIIDDKKDIPTNNYISGVELEENSTYYWRIKAIAQNGESSWALANQFKTGEKGPEAPVPLEPEDRSKNLPTTVTLKWASAERATSYHVQVATEESFFNRVVDNENVLDTTLEISGLDNYRIYYWKVAAKSEFGKSAWSDIMEFQTIGLPPAESPLLLTPFEDSKDVPIPVSFNWDPVISATKYTFQITTNSATFTVDDVSIEIPAPKTTIKYGELEENTTYYWRVRGENLFGAGPWSEKWSFNTGVVSVDEELAMLHDIKISPLPAGEYTYLEYTVSGNQNVSLNIYDITGSLVNRYDFGDKQEGRFRERINTTAMNPGSYYYVIQIGKYREMRKVIICY